MAPPGTRVIVHDKPGNITSWRNHGTSGWYIGPSLDHYICMQCYTPATNISRITDTLQYIPKTFAFPTTTTEDYLQQAIRDIIAITKDPRRHLIYCLMAMQQKNAINQIDHIFHRSISQPRLKNLPLPPLLPQNQSENLQLKNIPSIPVPALRLELVFKTLRLQIIQSSHTLPPRLQPSTSSSLDPYPNPWIKKLQNI